MNPFRTKKRAKEAPEATVRASTDSDGPSLPIVKASKTFRLGKKQQQPEPKLELDLSTALPSSDDFRTSLLMNGLSARFSMLREQDDPKSKIGKASDDSVLFAPSKRQSRLNDLTFKPHGLSDIAEVSSINSGRPWAMTRTESHQTVESNGTDEGSVHSGGIMNRAKPGEGNNLFGGRQKIYKIPMGGAGSTKGLGDGPGTGMAGRARYESDVSQSAFQKLREREKEQQLEQREEEAQSARPPSPYYNRNRETSSTTSSAEPPTTRISTAATSVTSQKASSVVGSSAPISPGGSASAVPGVERIVSKQRRLYETGLDQHLHEQQFSAMNRIDTLTRQRALGAQTPPGRNSPTTHSHPTEGWNSMVAGKSSMPNMRSASPSPTVPKVGAFDFKAVAPESRVGSGVPPLSPLMTEHDEHPVLAIQPSDRGKATALGTFSKPVQPYDENKYSQRQLQMQQGRENPPLRKHSPPRAFVPRQQVGRARADSNVAHSSGRSRSNSAQRHLPIDRIPETGPKPKASVSGEAATNSVRTSANGDSSAHHNEPIDHQRPNLHVRDLASLYRRNQDIPLEPPPESQHPANRQQPLMTQKPSLGSENNQSNVKESQPKIEELSAPTVTISTVPADSPTLGTSTEMTGLSGMVRQHLRSDSSTSSIYGMPPNDFNSHDDQPLPQHGYTVGKHPAASDDSNDNDADVKSSLDISVKSSKSDDAVLPPLSVRSTSAETTDSRDPRPSWERELATHHARDGSSATQKEREDFQNDLAARRRRVQENLKSFVETESRSTSPVPDLRPNPLGLLKSKTSRGSLVGKPKEPRPLKAPTFSRPSSPVRASLAEDPWREEDEQVLADRPKAPSTSPTNKAFLQARREAQRDRERMIAQRHQQRAMSGAGGPDRMNRSVEDLHRQRDPSRDRGPPNPRSRHQTPSRERKPPPVTFTQRNGNNRESQGSVDTNNSASRPGSRQSGERSGSDASQRPRSRNGRYRDDLSRPITERTSSPATRYDEFEPPAARHMHRPPYPNGMTPQQSPMQSPAIGSEPKNRSRNNSRSTHGGYFEHKPHPLQAGDARDPVPSPRIPLTIDSGNSTPNLPGPSPRIPLTTDSGNFTANLPGHSPVSAPNTPTAPGFQNQGFVPTHRKRSINKHDISEPRFVSSTSRMTTINLPAGASLQNGVEAPPIPPVNPRRKTRAVFGFGRKDDMDDYPASLTPAENRNTSSDDGEKSRSRQKLRKASSEGGNLNARARQATLAAPSPAMPEQSPTTARAPASHVEGGMF